MSSAALQARANALNAKMEGEAAAVLEDIEKQQLRKIARASFACAVKCYDTAGTTGPSDALEVCARNCQAPYQQATNMVQNEVAQFQNRLNRNMQECQEKARDMLGANTDASKIAKVENSLINCMEKQVNEHIKLLRPMRERITATLKKANY